MSVCLSACMPEYHTHAWYPWKPGHCIPWNYSYRWLWAAMSWELNMHPLLLKTVLGLQSPFMCVYESVFLYVEEHTYTHMCVQRSEFNHTHSSGAAYYFIWMQVLSLARGSPRLTAQLTLVIYLPLSSSSGILSLSHRILLFDVKFWDSNWGPHACRVRAFPCLS